MFDPSMAAKAGKASYGAEKLAAKTQGAEQAAKAAKANIGAEQATKAKVAANAVQK